MTQVTELAYAVSLVTQGSWRFYTLTMPSNILAECCYVSSRFDDQQEGFQRRLDKKRAQEIADYIDQGLGTIPSAVILSAQQDANFKLTGRGKTVRFKRLTRSFLVLDGQHRIYGYSLAKTSMRVPVVVYNGLNKEQEVKLFIDINTKQRPVPNELLLDIKRLAQYESEAEAILGQLFDRFNDRNDSALTGYLSAAEKQRNRISRVTFNSAIRPVLQKFSSSDAEVIYSALNAFLSATRRQLSAKDLDGVIADPIVFRSLIDIFPRIVRIVADRGKPKDDANAYFDAISPMFRGMHRKILSRPGSSYRALSAKLLNKIDSEPLL